MNTILGEDHPYGKTVQLEDYKKLSVANLRAFYKDNYNLADCKILISGKVDKDCIHQLNSFFGQEKTLKKMPQKPSFIIPNTNNSSIYIEKENALQSAIRIGRIVPNKIHKDYFGLQILNTVLGGYFGSRLMKNIREDKGYTYGIGSGILSLQHAGYFYISTEVGSDVTKKALDEIYKEIDIIRTKEISNEELELVKNYLLGQVLSSCDGPFSMASLFSTVNEYGLDYSFYNNYISTVKKITAKKLLALAIKYLDKADLTEVVVGKL